MRGPFFGFGFVLIALVSLVSAQPPIESGSGTPTSISPKRTEASSVPRNGIQKASSSILVSHPEEIQSELASIAEQLKAAGLIDEARTTLALAQRLRNQHHDKLQAAYLNSLEVQIALNVQILAVGDMQEVAAVFARHFPSSQPAKTPESAAMLSGCYDAAAIAKLIEEAKKAGHLQVANQMAMTILNGRKARILGAAPVPKIVVAGGQTDSGRTQDKVANPLDASLVVTATVIRDKTFSLESAVEIPSPDPQKGTSRVEANMELNEGDALVLEGLYSWENQVTESRVPVLGDAPSIGRLFRSTKATNVRRELLVVIRPEIIIFDASPPFIEGVSERVIKPAAKLIQSK